MYRTVPSEIPRKKSPTQLRMDAIKVLLSEGREAMGPGVMERHDGNFPIFAFGIILQHSYSWQFATQTSFFVNFCLLKNHGILSTSGFLVLRSTS